MTALLLQASRVAAQEIMCGPAPERLFQADVTPVYAHFAEQARLPSLADASSDSVGFEFRLWEFRNDRPVLTLRLRGDAPGRRASGMRGRGADAGAAAVFSPLVGPWDERWETVMAPGLRALPACGGQTWPASGPPALLELRMGSTYQNWSYMRDTTGSGWWPGEPARDRRMLELLTQIRTWITTP